MPAASRNEEVTLIVNDSLKLVASADYVPEGVPEEAVEEKDYTNGRIDPSCPNPHL